MFAFAASKLYRMRKRIHVGGREARDGEDPDATGKEEEEESEALTLKRRFVRQISSISGLSSSSGSTPQQRRRVRYNANRERYAQYAQAAFNSSASGLL